MTFTNISTYIETNKKDLIAKAIYEFESAKYITPIFGCKTAPVQLPLLDETIYFQSNASCGFTNSGITSISARYINPVSIKVNKSYCEKDFLDKWLNYELASAADKALLPAQEKFALENVNQVAKKLEQLIWKGDTTNSDGNLSQHDGLVKLIVAENASTVNKVYTGTTLTESNIYTIVKAALLATAAEVKNADDTYFFMGWDSFELLQSALVAADLYHYKPEDLEAGMLTIPGSKVKAVAIAGLNSTVTLSASAATYMFIMNKNNVFRAADGTGEEEKYTFDWESYDETFRFILKFISGVQIAFPDMITKVKISA
jgi:hypothetical protein